MIAILLITLTGCKKDWLDEKSDISRIVPTTLEDMGLLLNDFIFTSNYTALGEIAADDIVLPASVLASGSNMERNAYTWQKDVFQGSKTVSQWNNTYNQVFVTNVVLESLAKIQPSTGRQADWNDLRGRALFFRAKAFFDLVLMFTKPYNAGTASTDPGIPLRLKSDITAPTVRASLEQSYAQILADLKEAEKLLQPYPAQKIDPSKMAAQAFIARVYLAMNQYDKSLAYSDNCFESYNTLIDYNTLPESTANPFKAFNEETIFFSRQAGFTVLPISSIAEELYDSYDQNDLRRSVFFRPSTSGAYTFKGSYTGGTLLFGGFATNELLLTRAECRARLGDADGAVEDLNTLLVKRYRQGTFVPLVAGTAEQTLKMVLEERRKELVFTGLRWFDLRRLNQDPAHARTITRTVDGKTFTLPPGDPRYTFPIPDYIINSSKIDQNPR